MVLVGVFGGLLAATIPLAVGIWAIIVTAALLRLLTYVTDVSTFALNLTIAMGLALAVDYTLLIVSRFRDERADGADNEQALIRTMATAGRTVLFSALTVGCSMLALALFPMYFLRSFAFAGITVVMLTALSALIIGPAAFMVFGDRIDALDLRPLGRRLLRRPPSQQRTTDQSFWYRSAAFAIRHWIPVIVAGTAALLLLGAPFLGIKWGFPDERMLPDSASARQIGDQLREDFPNDPTTAITVVIPDMTGVNSAELSRFAGQLSEVVDVSTVSAPDGTYRGGTKIGPPSAPTGITDGSAFLTVNSTESSPTDLLPSQLDWLHAVIGPNDQPVLFGGIAQVTADNAAAINARLPLVLLIIAAITFALLFLLTGSVVLPVKALILNVLSLSATFGALVWIFQNGHLGALGTTATGTLVAHVPVLLFCIAFGLSMDYEVFLIARIREYWRASPQKTARDNDESIRLGLARTGRIVTAAALLMAISFAALMASGVSIMRMFGLGLTLAVLMDATLVRLLLVPAFMHALGRANWWAPERMRSWHNRLALFDEPADRMLDGAVMRSSGPKHRMPRQHRRNVRSSGR
jgi:RND superfamily putative drug exporter